MHTVIEVSDYFIVYFVKSFLRRKFHFPYYYNILLYMVNLKKNIESNQQGQKIRT